MKKEKSKNLSIFVCELGFSAMKYLYRGKKGRIPSAFQRKAGGMVYGDDALIEAGSSCMKTPQDLVTFYPDFVEHAAKEVGVEEEENILVIGLPYQFWLQEKEREDTEGTSTIATLQKSCASKRYRHVLVMPQGLGGVKAFLNETPNITGDMILGIDIGFNTIIYALYSISKNKIIYGSTSYKRGVHQMATQLLSPHLAKLTPGRSYTPVEISQILERGYVQYGFDQIPVAKYINDAAAKYTADTLRDVVGDVQGHLSQGSTFDNIIFFGGGTHLMKNVVPTKKVMITLMHEPEFANARGFEAIALEMAGGK